MRLAWKQKPFIYRKDYNYDILKENDKLELNKIAALCHSLGRSSRSDFVQSRFF